MGQPKIFHVLVVEDNPADASLIMRFLASGQKPMKVQVVEDGLEAIEYLERTGQYESAPRPDIVLLDLNLPRKDGWEVLGEVKSKPQFRNIPVLVMTTSSAERDVEKAYALNANSFMVKPSDLTRFQTLLKAVEMYWMDAVELPSREPRVFTAQG